MTTTPLVKSTKLKDTVPAPITGEALFQMNNTDLAELVEGNVVQMTPTGFWHGYVENKIGATLREFVSSQNLGLVAVGEVGIYTNRNPDTVRAADVLFISHKRLKQVQSQSYLDVAPELVVEIMSPGDSWREVMDKLDEYFGVGVQAVWIVDPPKQQVFVYRSLTKVAQYTASDSLSGGEILPGFSVSLAELFAKNETDDVTGKD